eukprot:359660-Chlamydomonas_euryale.AAC.11
MRLRPKGGSKAGSMAGAAEYTARAAAARVHFACSWIRLGSPIASSDAQNVTLLACRSSAQQWVSGLKRDGAMVAQQAFACRCTGGSAFCAGPSGGSKPSLHRLNIRQSRHTGTWLVPLPPGLRALSSRPRRPVSHGWLSSAAISTALHAAQHLLLVLSVSCCPDGAQQHVQCNASHVSSEFLERLASAAQELGPAGGGRFSGAGGVCLCVLPPQARHTESACPTGVPLGTAGHALDKATGVLHLVDDLSAAKVYELVATFGDAALAAARVRAAQQAAINERLSRVQRVLRLRRISKEPLLSVRHLDEACSACTSPTSCPLHGHNFSLKPVAGASRIQYAEHRTARHKVYHGGGDQACTPSCCMLHDHAEPRRLLERAEDLRHVVEGSTLRIGFANRLSQDGLCIEVAYNFED